MVKKMFSNMASVRHLNSEMNFDQILLS